MSRQKNDDNVHIIDEVLLEKVDGGVLDSDGG